MWLWAVEIWMPVSRAGVGGWAALGILTLRYLSGLQAEEQAAGWNCEAGVAEKAPGWRTRVSLQHQD